MKSSARFPGGNCIGKDMVPRRSSSPKRGKHVSGSPHSSSLCATPASRRKTWCGFVHFSANCKLVPARRAHVSFSRRSCICGGRRKLHARAAPPASVLDWRGHPAIATLRLSERTPLLRRNRRCRRRLRRRTRRRNAGYDSERGVRFRPFLGREKRDLSDSNKIVRTANVTQSRLAISAGCGLR